MSNNQITNSRRKTNTNDQITRSRRGNKNQSPNYKFQIEEK